MEIWVSTYLFIIPSTLPTMNVPIKSHPSLTAIFRYNFSIKLSWLQKSDNKN